MTRRSMVITMCLASALTAAVNADAQSSVSGRVVDQTGLPLPGVVVEMSVQGTRTETSSGRDGTYRFDRVPSGAAELSYRQINFAEVRRSLTIDGSARAIADVVLPLAMNADLVVTGMRTFRNLADVPDPAATLVGIAHAGSEGAVTPNLLANRPILRAGEILESVPGVIVTQHSGEGKANQYYLRGFNLDHGTDLALTVAGVPVNMPTHGHGHGYADLSFLIPELVSGIQFRKGAYNAEDGDFSAAGSANVNYLNAVDRPFLAIDAGQNRWRRVLGAASPSVGGGHLLTALELVLNDGPWIRPDAYTRVNGLLRYSVGDTRRGASLTASVYRGEWSSTDQVPRRALESGLIPRYGSLNTSDGGRSSRYSLAADAQFGSGTAATRVSAYAVKYGLNLFSDFTYFLDDPVNGDQFEQLDRRWVSGGRIVHRRLGKWRGRSLETMAGAQLRRDDIGQVGLFKTRDRQRLSTTRLDAVAQTSTGAFAQAEIEWSKHLRTVLGLRGDVYHFDVASDNPLNSGARWSGLASPKASVIVGPWQGTELYVNGGTGFHSNDARGATATVDPSSGDPVTSVTPLVRARSGEVGLRTVRIPHVQTSVSAWMLGFDSELLFVGDAGTTEASRPSRRSGIEWSTYASVRPWLMLDADVSFSRGRFTDRNPAGNRIPGAIDRVIAAGLTVPNWKGASGSLRLRHFGSRPLVEDGSVQSKATSLVSVEGGYRVSARSRIVLEVFNLLDARDSDVDYFYRSRLPGEDGGGVDDIHTHPAVPRTFRLSLHVGL